MIQMLTYAGKEEGYIGEKITVNSIHDARALDDFEINIINLRNKYMWYNSSSHNNNLNCMADIISLSTMIKSCKQTQVIILLPMNLTYCYERWGNDYTKKKELKNMLDEMTSSILSNLHPIFTVIKLKYENTITKLSGKDVAASFYFSDVLANRLLYSDKSKKATAIEYEKIILTSLDLKTYEDVMNFLSAIGLLEENEDVPDWMKEIQMFDDVKQFGIIEYNNQVIRQAKDEIISEREKIHENQINLAKRNGSLIIETMTLLIMFEKYVSGELTRDQCIDILKSKTGLLKISDF